MAHKHSSLESPAPISIRPRNPSDKHFPRNPPDKHFPRGGFPPLWYTQDALISISPGALFEISISPGIPPPPLWVHWFPLGLYSNIRRGARPDNMETPVPEIGKPHPR